MHKLSYWQNEWDKKLISKLTAFFIFSMIDYVINVKDEKKEEVINRNESDESEMFFIFSMIDCVINVEDEKKEEVIDKIESDESEDRKTWENEENKNEDNITEKHVSVATETFWSFECIARRVRAFWVWMIKMSQKLS